MKENLIKYSLIVIFMLIAIYLNFVFYVGFALIVRPQIKETKELTLNAMKNYCMIESFKNLIYTIAISALFFFLTKTIIKKNLHRLIIVFIFLIISNFGSIRGSYEYYFGLQNEFKYHRFQK